MEQQPLGLRFFRILCDSPSMCGVHMEGEPPPSPPVEQDWASPFFCLWNRVCCSVKEVVRSRELRF